MRVDSISAFPLRIKAEEKLVGGTFSYPHFQTVLVRADVDGVSGWGEAMTRFDPGATAGLVGYLARGLEGKSFPAVGAAWESCWRELRIRGHTRGTDVEALSGIEIALYDALGRAEGKAVGSYFAASPRRATPAFAGSLFSSRGSLKAQVAVAKERGLMGAKVKVGFGHEADRETLESVRKEWQDGMLVADANGAYDARGAAKACRAFAKLGLSWFEEPVPSDDLDGYLSLRGMGVKIGGGESWFAGELGRYLESGFVDVVEPSVSRCGGIAAEVEAGRAAGRLGLGFSPMTGMNSAISLAASLQVSSAVDSLGVEYNPFPNPLQTELASGLDEPKGGAMTVPDGHGLGIEVDERFVKAHLV